MTAQDMLGFPVTPSFDIQTIQNTLHSSAWLYASVYRLAFAISSIGVRVVKTSSGEEAKSRKAKDLLKLVRRINPEETYQDFIEANMVHLGTAGESYLEKVRNRLGEVTELWTWNPENVEPIPDGSGTRRILGYRFRVADGRAVVLKAEDVVPIRVYNPGNSLRGMSAVPSIWDDIQGDKNAARYNRALLKQGARPGGIIMPTEGDLGPEELERLRQSMRMAQDGPHNAGKTMVLPHGINYERDSQTNKDMDFLNMRKFSREVVAGIVGVPPLVIGNFDSANYANAREQLRAFWDYVGKPWLMKILGALNESLVHPEIDEDLELRADMAQIDALVDSQTTRVDNVSKLVQGGILTLNEGRKELGKQAIPDGDKLLLPLNLTPVDIDDVTTPKAEPVAPPAPPPDEDDEDSAPDEDTEEEPKAAILEAQKGRERDRSTMRAAHDLQLERAETKLQREVEKYLHDQGLRFVEKLRVLGAAPDINMLMGNKEMEAREAMKALAPHILATIQDSADLHLSRLGMQKDGKDSGVYRRKADGPERLPEIIHLLDAFNLSNPRVLGYLERFFLVHLESLTTETLASVEKSLTGGMALGEGVNELVLRLENLPAFNKRRAEKVARTETIGAWNLGAQEAFQAAGTPRKSWLSTRDGQRVRVSHRAIDDETSAKPILTTERFHLVDAERGTADLMFPGDPEAPGWAAIECRCAMVPEDEVDLAFWVDHCKRELEAASAQRRIQC